MRANHLPQRLGPVAKHEATENISGTGYLSIAGLLQIRLITNLEQFVEKPSMLGKAAIALLLVSYPSLDASQFSWINKDEGLRLCK